MYWGLKYIPLILVKDDEAEEEGVPAGSRVALQTPNRGLSRGWAVRFLSLRFPVSETGP